MRRIIEISVDGQPICFRHARHIMHTLHATLDFQAINAALNDVRDLRQQAEILRVHDIGAALVFLYGKILPWTRFFHKRVFPTTRLRTGAAVGVAPREITREQAAAGI